MSKAELSQIEERDETQRALGCVGLSAFAHVGLLIAILLAPSFKESAGVATGTKAGIEFSGESIADAAPAGLPQAPATDSATPVEVLLADANDPNAVALPNTQTAEPTVKTADIAPVEIAPAKKRATRKAKPAVESADIASALTQARKEAAKAPQKPAKVATEKTAPAPIETSDADDIAASAQKDEASEAQPVAETDAQAAQTEEAVPLQVALPEKESLTEAQANALQAPGAVGGTGTTAVAARGLPASLGANGTVSGATQSRGGTTGIGIPYGAQVRDARTLRAMPGNPLPTYPLPDRIANREGTAVLIGHVRNDGRIEKIALEKSSGSRLMDESAAKAFSQWKYRPGQEGYVRLPMQFKLVGDARVIPAQLNRQ